MITAAILFGAVAVATFIALRRTRSDPPPLTVTFTASTAAFRQAVQDVAAAGERFNMAMQQYRERLDP